MECWEWCGLFVHLVLGVGLLILYQLGSPLYSLLTIVTDKMQRNKVCLVIRVTDEIILEELEMFTLRYLPSPNGYCLYLLLWSKYTWDRVMPDLCGLFIYIYISMNGLILLFPEMNFNRGFGKYLGRGSPEWDDFAFSQLRL